MIGRKSDKNDSEDRLEIRGFDDFEVCLGDIMRGERATLGKSLLDVQRDLKIKAGYIAAIEATDPSAFDTPSFIAGYVRSYARYLDMDPDETFATFCAESGFEVAHGMSSKAASSTARSTHDNGRKSTSDRSDVEPFLASPTPFLPDADTFWSKFEPRAIGPSLVLVALIAGIGWGAFAVLQQVQRVNVAPVDQSPVALSDLDPVALPQSEPGNADGAGNAAPVRVEAFDRLYRPQALDVPILEARDAPIATLDPRDVGTLAAPVITSASLQNAIAMAGDESPTGAERPSPQVIEDLGPTIRMVAAYPAWVRVRSADGATLFETTMQPGDTYDIPATENPPTLRVGDSGAIYFAMGADCFGPVGGRGVVTGNFLLDRVALAETLDAVKPNDTSDALNVMLASTVGVTDVGPMSLTAALPCQPE